MNTESRWAEIAHFTDGLEAQMHQRVDELLEQNKSSDHSLCVCHL